MNASNSRPGLKYRETSSSSSSACHPTGQHIIEIQTTRSLIPSHPSSMIISPSSSGNNNYHQGQHRRTLNKRGSSTTSSSSTMTTSAIISNHTISLLFLFIIILYVTITTTVLYASETITTTTNQSHTLLPVVVIAPPIQRLLHHHNKSPPHVIDPHPRRIHSYPRTIHYHHFNANDKQQQLHNNNDDDDDDDDKENNNHKPPLSHRTIISPLTSTRHHHKQSTTLDDHILPVSDETTSCRPMASWQTTPRPSCNNIHELDMTRDDFRKVGSGGWRLAWRWKYRGGGVLDDGDGGGDDDDDDGVVCVKTLKLSPTSDFNQNTLRRHFIDATLTERLTSSPHVINIYAYCAQSTVNDYAATTLQRLVRRNNHSSEKFLTMETKVRYVGDVARGVADLHAIPAEGSRRRVPVVVATAVYKDLKPSNVVLMEGGGGGGGGERLAISDFNDGEMLRWNTTSDDDDDKACYFRRRRWTANFHSPEEVREKPLTEKIDVYALGSIIYYILVGYQPYDKMSTTDVFASVANGITPVLPEEYSSSHDPLVMMLVRIMRRCHEYEPEKRPSAREVAEELDRVILMREEES